MAEEKRLQNVIREASGKYDRIADLVQDVWAAEVYQNGHGKANLVSNPSLGDEQLIPMPCNWLSDLRDYIHHLKRINQQQKDEYCQMLAMFEVSPRHEHLPPDGTDTASGIYIKEEDEDDDSERLGDLVSSERGAGEPAHREMFSPRGQE